MKNKENLVLVHSFPTNSILLRGLILFLKDYFHVYPVDLPGFISSKPPLTSFSINGMSQYLDDEIKRLNLDHYIVGGISFGFWVLCFASLDTKCVGVFALEPYIGFRSIKYERLTVPKRLYYMFVIKLIGIFNLYKKVWRSKYWHKAYNKLSGYKTKRNKVIFEEMDPETFARCAYFLLSNIKPARLHDLPTVLLINPNDSTLDAKYILKFFKKHARHYMIIRTDIGHYPRKVTKTYFKKHLKKKDIKSIYNFLGSYAPNT